MSSTVSGPENLLPRKNLAIIDSKIIKKKIKKKIKTKIKIRIKIKIKNKKMKIRIK